MAFSGISFRTPPRCHVSVGIFTLVAILVISFVMINYNSSPRPLVRHLTGRRSAMKYKRLQPLREMFANASKVKGTGQRSNIVGSTAQRKANTSMLSVSDLQEVQNKESVLLLLIVTTAPSRYERREAIRQTWWKKCDDTNVSWKQLQLKFWLFFTEMKLTLWTL